MAVQQLHFLELSDKSDVYLAEPKEKVAAAFWYREREQNRTWTREARSSFLC